jgi:streptogramin lyase
VFRLAALLTLALATHAAAQPNTLLVSNETGTTISTLNPATGATGTFLSGVNLPDGLVRTTGGTVYFTEFGTGPGNGTFNRADSPTSFTQLATGFNGAGQLVMDPAGTFYLPNFGAPAGGGTSIARITPTGGGGFSSTANFATGLSTPSGVGLNGLGQLFVTEFNSNEISRIDTMTGAVTLFVGEAGFVQPSAIAFDSLNNMYVTNFGNGTVSRVTPAGVVTHNYATGTGNAFGIVLDEPNGVFYVSDYYAGVIRQFAFAGGPATIVGTGFNGPTHMVLVPVPEPSWVLLVAVVVITASYRRGTSGS